MGPYSAEEVRSRIARSELRATDFGWHEGLPSWQPLSSLLGLETPAQPPQPPIPSLPARYAGFWRRVIALVIDSLVCAVPAYAIGYVFGMGMYQQGITSKSDLETMGNVLGIIIWWLYFATMESSPPQGTLGKLAIGIKVTDSHGGRITFGRATGRHFAKILSALILCIGFLMAAFTERKQALHDSLADCLVVCR